MSLNLNATSSVAPSAYIDAVNDARFVRTFGIITVVGSILIFLGGGVAVGVGLAVMGLVMAATIECWVWQLSFSVFWLLF